jgi:chromosome segregation ATPase
MENTKKSNEYEPTLLDVLEAVQTGFTKMEEKMEEKFDDLGYRVTAVEKRVGAVEVTLEGMKETLESIERAVDKDAVTVVNHEHRIEHLEKACV